MALTTWSLLVSCAFICVAFIFGAFFLARSVVRLVRLHLCPLLRRRHRLLLPMLIKLRRMQLSLQMTLPYMLMMSRFRLMRRLFRLHMRLFLLTLSGLIRMPVPQLFSLLVFCLSLPLSTWGSLPYLRCGPVFVSAISPLVMPYICLWSGRNMLFSRVTPVLTISMHRVLLSGVSLILSALLVVVLVSVARLCGLIWSFIVSTSSYLGSVRSLSPGVLSCLLVVVSPSWKRFLRFVPRRLAYVVLVYLRFPLCSLLEFLLCRLLHRPHPAPVLLRSYLLLRAARVGLVLTAATAIWMVMLSISASRRRNTCVRRDHQLQGLLLLLRHLQPPP
ncbi:uncharacterized protein LOC119354555 [Triticum dicoccoides]|uniref:uncharacterized protein LOC119354555 n=1 Tax=Triticum dicoccoides TaxID=85692 RepID=UPI00188DD491|nr:uncharacterized protein LOC119354555 [Triticum dicoccoides]